VPYATAKHAAHRAPATLLPRRAAAPAAPDVANGRHR
jgi:hypothetical protein